VDKDLMLKNFLMKIHRLVVENYRMKQRTQHRLQQQLNACLPMMNQLM
jgi:hypothetical protein